MAILYHTEGVKNPLRLKRPVTNRIKKIISAERFTPGEINIIFCSDAYLVEINKKYLSKNYHTDVITFDYSDNKVVSGDIFISTDTVISNSKKFNTPFENELLRVIIHGVLHLMKYDDKTPAEKKIMTQKENLYLV